MFIAYSLRVAIWTASMAFRAADRVNKSDRSIDHMLKHAIKI